MYIFHTTTVDLRCILWLSWAHAGCLWDTESASLRLAFRRAASICLRCSFWFRYAQMSFESWVGVATVGVACCFARVIILAYLGSCRLSCLCRRGDALPLFSSVLTFVTCGFMYPCVGVTTVSVAWLDVAFSLSHDVCFPNLRYAVYAIVCLCRGDRRVFVSILSYRS